MIEIGKKIKDIRTKRGLTQEALAEYAKINLRTIQRIKNNESEPRGKTLSLICEVLDVNIEDLLDYGKREDKSYLMYLHLSVLIGLILPLGNIILPFILWVNRKDINEIGANLLNFQIVWSVFLGIIIVIGKLLEFTHIEIGPGNFILSLYAWLILYPINIFLPIFLAIRTKKGKVNNSYPRIIQLIK